MRIWSAQPMSQIDVIFAQCVRQEKAEILSSKAGLFIFIWRKSPLFGSSACSPLSFTLGKPKLIPIEQESNLHGNRSICIEPWLQWSRTISHLGIWGNTLCINEDLQAVPFPVDKSRLLPTPISRVGNPLPKVLLNRLCLFSSFDFRLQGGLRFFFPITSITGKSEIIKKQIRENVPEIFLVFKNKSNGDDHFKGAQWLKIGQNVSLFSLFSLYENQLISAHFSWLENQLVFLAKIQFS